MKEIDETSILSFETLNKADKYLDIASKSLGVAFKLSVLIGAGIVLFYLASISYYPTNVGFGDGVLFVLAATVFGGLFLLLVGLLWSIGTTLNWLINWFLWFVSFLLYSLHRKTQEKVNRKSPKPNMASVIICLITLFIASFLIVSGQIGWSLLFGLLAISLLIGVLWSTINSFYDSLFRHKELLFSEVQKAGKKPDSHLRKKIREAKIGIVQVITLVLLITFTLVIELNLVDWTMRALKVKAENMMIYVAEPYTSIIAESVKPENYGAIKESYTRFTNVNILFHGVGKDVLIEFGNPAQRLRVASDKIIIKPANDRLHSDGGARIN